jgi:cathepsin L
MRETNNVFTGEEYQTRFGIWMANKRLVSEHNRKSTFKVAMNKLSHYTPSEYRSLLGYKQMDRLRRKSSRMNVKAPESIDWREKGVVNAIKDQAQCGSCWAFSAIQAQESQWAIKHAKLYSLSEQNLIDCDSTSSGCDGGLMENAYEYVIKNQNGKFMLEDDYPYAGIDGTCKFDASKAVTQIVSFLDVTEGDEKDLAEKIAQYGPASIAIDASDWSFQLYSSGIYDESACSSSMLDHGVGCVGYGSENGVNYWIVRNSWGTSWGEKGYIRMIKDKSNQCGEATQACIPVDA